MTCSVIEHMTYRADGIQSKRHDLWAIEQMVNRANGTRANGHRANGNRVDVVAPYPQIQHTLTIF